MYEPMCNVSTEAIPVRERPDCLQELSDRELDVVQQLVDGNSTDRGAAELYISRHTFRTHVKNIYRKLGTHSSLELVSLAVENGMRPNRSGTPS